MSRVPFCWAGRIPAVWLFCHIQGAVVIPAPSRLLVIPFRILPLEVPKGQPQASFTVGFSVWVTPRSSKRTTTSFFSCRVLCMGCSSWPEKNDHKLHFLWSSLYGLLLATRKGRPQASFPVAFSVWVTPRSSKRTTTSFFSRRALCMTILCDP